MASTADRAAATALKVKGNKAFTEHDWPTAIDFYTKAIEKNDADPSFYCNRAQANIKLEAYGYAIADATKALELDKDYIKVCRPQALALDCPLIACRPGLLETRRRQHRHPQFSRRSPRFQDGSQKRAPEQRSQAQTCRMRETDQEASILESDRG